MCSFLYVVNSLITLCSNSSQLTALSVPSHIHTCQTSVDAEMIQHTMSDEEGDNQVAGL